MSASKNLIAILFISCVFLSGALFSETIESDHGMVASAHPLASGAGLQILQQGGNAVDAAVAMALALAVVEPNASGLGGGGFLVVKMAGEPSAVTVDYRESAPQKATAQLYYGDSLGFDKRTHHGPWSIGVPGVVAGLDLILKKYGSMNFLQVSEPAIRLAEQGFEVSANFESMIIQAYDMIIANPATAEIYLTDGLPASAGSIIKNPDLAATLKQIADNGTDCFYRGKLAEAIVRAVQQEGGILQKSDLQAYRAQLKNPVTGTYRGYQIISSAPPTGGGTHLIELLNILEGFDLRSMQPGTPEYLHLFAEALKMALADKAQNMADPDFFNVPVAQLTSAEHAKELRNFINPKTARTDYMPPEWLARESGSTTHLSVVDESGNVVALTQSINSWFGSGITVPGAGIILNNHLADFDSKAGHANSIEPGKRPVSSIAPAIILKDGKPFLTIGTPGGSRIIGALAQIIINIIDFGMEVDAAIEAPRIHVSGNTVHLESRIPAATIKSLEAMGHPVKIHPEFDNYFGGAQGILIDPVTGKLNGGADSRRDGVAVGY